jgi:hypothetical protein
MKIVTEPTQGIARTLSDIHDDALAAKDKVFIATAMAVFAMIGLGLVVAAWIAHDYEHHPPPPAAWEVRCSQ